MFRPKREQRSLFSASTLLPEAKRRRLEQQWPEVFRTKALPLIDERAFAHLYDPGNGRPNKAVQTLVALLVLKEMWDLTDEEVLFNLDYHLAYQVALDLDVDEAHCCQKTLHNFRKRLIESESDALLFETLTDRIVAALGVDTSKQRLDSTHIVSNIRRLTRLGLFCETIRVFLSAVKDSSPRKFEAIPVTLRQRYLKDDGKATRFGDAASKETRRRLAVTARDVWRLVDRFRGQKDICRLKPYALLERLLKDQCDVVASPLNGEEGDADQAEPGAPVTVKEPEKVRSDSLQSPHDPDATYNKHKGKGYEVQVAETHGNVNVPEIITHVEVTRSADSDQHAAVPVVEALAEREIQPDDLTADTTYGATENVIALSKLGTELVSPVPGNEAGKPKEGEVRPEDFTVDPNGHETPVCPALQLASKVERDEERGSIRVFFDAAVCDKCHHRDGCPTRRLKDGTRVLNTTEHDAVLAARRVYEGMDEFAERYAARAGIEATNSELKRRHGLGRPRVRGQLRVRLAVYLKAAACNVKRMLNHIVKTIAGDNSAADLAPAGAR
jgi:hypothetical protein